jgi:putative transposase
LGKTLEECANKYRGFCKKYRPKSKPETRNHWGNKLLAGMKVKSKGKNKSSPGQQRLPWDNWEAKNEEIEQVAEKFIFANCYNPQFVGSVLQNSHYTYSNDEDDQYQVSESCRLRRGGVQARTTGRCP